jgi:glycogen phosphorylase
MLHLRPTEPLPSADVEELRAAIVGKLTYSVGREIASASLHDWFFAIALAVRDRIVDRWMDARRLAVASQRKQV